jgi:chemotaxis methyl-accepting protein methylase
VTFEQFLREAAQLEELSWRKYRRRSARHRIELRIGELGLGNFDTYLELLHSAPEERLVRLEQRNLMSDPLPSDMDLVLCRYLAFTYYPSPAGSSPAG